MKTIKGPGIFLAQFAGDEAPFNTLENLAQWTANLGFVGVQIPTWDQRLFDLKRAAESQEYCDEILGVVRAVGLEVTELSTHIQGQLVASHPAYDTMLEGFAPAGLDARARQAWAVQQLHLADGVDCARYIFGCPGLAVLLSLAAAACGAYGRGFCRAGAEMATDSECL
jgi:sugar phosphate isomerase/epimerase